MKIESSNILLNSQHSAIEKHTVKESLRVWVGDQRPDPSVGLRAGFEGRSRQQPNPAPPIDSVRLSAGALAAAQTDTNKQVTAVDPEKALENDPRYQLIILMVEALTGKKIKLIKLEDVQPAVEPANIPDPSQAAAPEQPKPAGYGVEYERHETHYESEQAHFSAEGVVRTADGKDIRFNLALTMSREHFEQSDASLRLGDAKKIDPLVINFGGTAAQLTGEKFSFDLDADGKTDQISFVGAGSGFLALDKNADGKINNGSELFGPASGNGFQELATYDQDKNDWIDENDAIYAQLKVWTNDALSTLAQKKVGAIYLGNVSTPFDIKNGQNQLDGQVRSSGIYLSSEDSGAGTVQQIDLAV